MVKGLTRQVVIVDTPDPALFEQAIFVVRDGAFAGMTPEKVISQAREVARSYAERRERRRPGWRGLWWTALGAGGMGLVWLLTAFL